jgi:hypothetical protein
MSAKAVSADAKKHFAPAATALHKGGAQQARVVLKI